MVAAEERELETGAMLPAIGLRSVEELRMSDLPLR
jgi:hypothetical protein